MNPALTAGPALTMLAGASIFAWSAWTLSKGNAK